MNVQQARAIPLRIILEKLEATCTKQKQNEDWYLSPFREEKTASFHVNIGKNIWYDFGEGIGGNSVDLVCEYLKRSREDFTPADALRWLRNMACAVPMPKHAREVILEKQKLSIKKITDIRHLALKRYIRSRGIDDEIAKNYLKEVYVLNEEKFSKFFALGLKNEDGGWDLRNPFLKGSAGPKSITFIRGNKPKPSIIDVFEGMFDFLSILACEKKEQMEGDAIILNSISCLSKAVSYIKGYGYSSVRTWFDNDKAGKQATETFRLFANSEFGLRHIAMNEKYRDHKDVNAWHMNALGLKVQP